MHISGMIRLINDVNEVSQCGLRRRFVLRVLEVYKDREAIILILTRKLMQSIHIGHDIVITVTKVTGGSVRLGIVAPQRISIRRSEVPEPKIDSHQDLTT